MFLRILDCDISVPITNSWDVKLSVICFCLPFSHLGFLFAISWSRSYFQHSSSVPAHFGLLCTIFLHDPIGVWCTLVYCYCWFQCSILPVLHPNWCTWHQFFVLPFRLIPLPFDELLMSLVHIWCISGAYLVHQVHRAIVANSFPWESAVSSVAKMMQCCLTGV